VTEFIIEHRTQIFPSILIVLDVVAAIFYMYDSNIRMAIYWLSAAILTTTVTY